jgi:hypothetical protein
MTEQQNEWVEDKEYTHSNKHIRFYSKKHGEGYVFSKDLHDQIRRNAVNEFLNRNYENMIGLKKLEAKKELLDDFKQWLNELSIKQTDILAQIYLEKDFIPHYDKLLAKYLEQRTKTLKGKNEI